MPFESLPLVSIVTPSFNQGRFLRRTIESVLGQGYSRIEYFVVDGASMDESPAILRSYGSRLKWISEPDRGQAHAINKGMALADGEILAYLNSDDVLLPGAVERAARFFVENPECDLIFGDALLIDEDDRVTGAYPTADYDYQRLKEECFFCQPAVFWRRRTAERVGIFDETLHFAMDYDYWLRVAGAGCAIRRLPERLACSRTHSETKTVLAPAEIRLETIRVCWRNAGAVHPKYFAAYWHHVVHDRKDGFGSMLRAIPKLERVLSYLHRRCYPVAREISKMLGRE